MTMTRSVASSTTRRDQWADQDGGEAQLPLQVLDRVHHRLLDDHAQRGGPLVEDDQPRLQRDSASADIETRCRIPPGKLVRVAGQHRRLRGARPRATPRPGARCRRATGLLARSRAFALRTSPKWCPMVRTGPSAVRRHSAGPAQRTRRAAPGAVARRVRLATSVPSKRMTPPDRWPMAVAASRSGRTRGSTGCTWTSPTSPTNSPCSRVRSTSRTDQIRWPRVGS